MIIILSGATATKHLGGLNFYYIRNYTSGMDLTLSQSSVKKDEASTTAITGTLIVKDGYTLSEAVVIKMGSVDKTSAWYNASTGAITIPAGSLTDNVTISGKATSNSSSGEDDGIIAYTSRISSAGISKTTGEQLSSSTGYVNVYENIDASKAYYASSYAPASTGDNACVCYYTSDGTFISAESGSDWGINSAEYTSQKLTVPSNTGIIKLFGRTNNSEALLSHSNGGFTEVNYSSQQTSANLNEETGEYGSSSTGYVNVYDNIDISKTYYASGFCPKDSGTAAAVCYYTSDGTFISAQDGNDFGKSSENFSYQKLTVPSNASTIKVFAQNSSGYTPAALYVKQ